MPLPSLALLIPTINATPSNPVDLTGALSTLDLSAAMVDSLSTVSRVNPLSVALASVMH
jgi:hypothetical protein